MKRAERRFAEILQDVIAAADEDFDGRVRVRSYEDAGILTHNAGLVVRLPDGSEFQLTIVQSENGEACPDCGADDCFGDCEEPIASNDEDRGDRADAEGEEA